MEMKFKREKAYVEMQISDWENKCKLELHLSHPLIWSFYCPLWSSHWVIIPKEEVILFWENKVKDKTNNRMLGLVFDTN